MKHVVSLSGGKDSTALALRLAEVEPRDYTYLIAPTGNELPDMIAHWAKLSKLLGKPLTPVSRVSLQGEIVRQRALPNHRQRWCTRIIKLEPLMAWQRGNTPCVSYVGLRADEPTRTGAIFEPGADVFVRFPLREWGWGLNEVIGYLAEHGVEIPKRTDCAACFWQRLGEWYELWRDWPDQYAEAESLELFVQKERGENYTLRSKSRDSWPALLTDLRLAFEAGRVPTISLKKMEDARRNVGVCRVCTL